MGSNYQDQRSTGWGELSGIEGYKEEVREAQN